MLEIHRDAAVAEVFFHLCYSVILEVRDRGHEDRVRPAVNNCIVKMFQRSSPAGGNYRDIDRIRYRLIKLVVVAGLRPCWSAVFRPRLIFHP